MFVIKFIQLKHSDIKNKIYVMSGGSHSSGAATEVARAAAEAARALAWAVAWAAFSRVT